MLRDQQRDEGGFTLIEVLMALVILGIGIATLLTAMATHAKTSLANRNQAAAETLLTASAEYVKSLPFATYPCSGLSGTVTSAQVAHNVGEFVVTYGPGVAVSGVSLCSIQSVPVRVKGVGQASNYDLSVVVVKRPVTEPTP
jgi:prepilin-type N-terminal cleavage/methylation domain-containing protein